MRTVAVLGATGSVGQPTLDLISREMDAFVVQALTGAGNVAPLAHDAARPGARLAVTAREEGCRELRDRLGGTEVAADPCALPEAASRPADRTTGAILGVAGLVPNLAMLRRGGTLRIASKERSVAAGSLVMAEARAHGAVILPVDGEHSGAFQALRGEDRPEVGRAILAASGGAFRKRPLDRIARAPPEEASSHPTWTMGRRITVHLASMFNKGWPALRLARRVMDRSARDDGMPRPLGTEPDLHEVQEADRLARLWAEEAAGLAEG